MADRDELMLELKRLIVHECQKEIAPEAIGDDTILFGDPAGLDLDSLDALQISMAVQRRYGKRIDGGNETRSALKSVSTLADFIAS